MQPQGVPRHGLEAVGPAGGAERAAASAERAQPAATVHPQQSAGWLAQAWLFLEPPGSAE